MQVGDKLYRVSDFDGELKVVTVTEVYPVKNLAVVSENDIKMYLGWYDVNNKTEYSWSTSERRALLLHKFYRAENQLELLRAEMDSAIGEIDKLDYKEACDE